MIDTLLNNLGITDGSDTLTDTNSNVEMDDYSSGSSLSTSESVFSESLHQHDSALGNSLDVDHSSSLSLESQIDGLSSNDNFENQDFHETESINEGFGNSISTQEVGFAEMSSSPLIENSMQHSDTMTDVATSSIDIDNFVNVPTTDHLEVSNEDIETLQERVEGIERSEHKGEISFGKKMCPTRHGCQGATDCDYSYGSYP